MRIEDLEFIKKSYKSFDLNKQQLAVLQYIIKGNNALKTIQEISNETGKSVYLVRTTFNAIQGYIDDYSKKINRPYK